MAALPPTLAANSLLSDFKINPRGHLFTASVDPLCFDDKCVLLGDAGHAILPFYGQGMNAGFEDVRLLFVSLEGGAADTVSGALTNFSQSRLPDAQAIDILARLNYHEMRYQVRRRLFRAKCRVFLALEWMLPGIFQSRYTMIAFTSIPYSRILLRERIQLGFLLAIVVVVLFCLFSLLI
jgi:kynurenine 3-monooxygenase